MSRRPSSRLRVGSAFLLMAALSALQGCTGFVAARKLYALVRYSEAPSRYAYWIAPLRDAGPARVGDRVQINILHCHVPLHVDAS